MIESAEEFIRLRTSDDEAEYQRAASADAPDHVWAELIENHPEMRFWVAQNKTVPVSVLAELASDSDAKVRVMVAMKRKLTRSLFELLASDRDEGVRAAIARNAKCPPDLRDRLRSDASEVVRDAAASRT